MRCFSTFGLIKVIKFQGISATVIKKKNYVRKAKERIGKEMN